MTVGYILLWLVGISAASLVVRSFQNRGKSYGWLLTASLVLVAMGISAFFFDLDDAGYIGGALWFFLILVPNLGMKLISRWSLEQKFTNARYLSYALAAFHPADGFLEMPGLLTALERAQRGKPHDLPELVKKFQDLSSPLSRIATLYLFSLNGNWAELLHWLQDTVGLEEVEQDGSLLTSYLRALGETGQLNELVYYYESRKFIFPQLGPGASAISKLFVLAFCGRVSALTRHLQHSKYPSTTKTFWTATAEMAAGNPEAGAFILRTLGIIEDIKIKRAVERRLVQPVPIASTILNTATSYQLDFIENEPEAPPLIRHSRLSKRRALVTQILVGLNIIVFGIEVYLGGSENNQVLLYMGGLLPELVELGQWWRLLAATFLHFGPLHLAMNMFALYVIGPFVETSLRWWGYTLLYFFAGIGSMFTVTYLVNHGILRQQFLVGASGAISGLIGATAALLLHEWRRERTAGAFRRLQSIGFAVLIQVAFDLSTRQVSFTAHLSGAIAGFLFTFFYVLIKPPAPAR